MKNLTPADIVGIWESGHQSPDWRKAVITLASALPDLGKEDLAALSIGQRNAYLLALREALIGPIMRARVACPRCKEQLEFEQIIAELLDGYVAPEAQTFDHASGEYELRYRLLTSADLAQAATRRTLPDAEASLIANAIVDATCGGEPAAAAALPAELIETLGDAIAAADPLARVRVPLACAGCEHVWRASIDIVTFLWTELDFRAREILEDVVTLARHYGWNESDILAMSSARRQYYLGMIE